MKKKSSSFKIRNSMHKLDVSFKVFNEKVVYCHVRDMSSEPYLYTGKALCNTKEGDVFDIQTGKDLALERALAQYSAYVTKSAKDFYNSMQNAVETAIMINANRGAKEEK